MTIARVAGVPHPAHPLELLCLGQHAVELTAAGPRLSRTVFVTVRSGLEDFVRAENAREWPMRIPPGLESVIAAHLTTVLREPLAHADDSLPDIVEGLVSAIVDRIRARREDGIPEWLQTLRDSLPTGLRGPLTLTGLADQAGVHPVYLARAFRHHFGSPIGRHLRRLRVASAARALAFSDVAHSTIAYEVGFYDQSHLNRWLVREAGSTPSEFRHFAREALGHGSPDASNPMW
jgi:AraC-like DNA-binding protein